VVVALLTRRDINTPPLFKWRVKDSESDPAIDELGRPSAGYQYEESWDTPSHQGLLREAIAATTARPDFIDLKHQVDALHHSLHVLGVGLIAGVDSAVMSQKKQASFKPWLLGITNHAAPVRQQSESLMAVAVSPSVDLHQALVTTGAGAAGANPPVSALRERQRIHAHIAAAAIGDQLGALDSAPLIVLPATAMPGLPAFMRVSPSTTWIVLSIFLFRLPGDTPQLCDHANLKHFRLPWWDTDNFRDLNQPVELRVAHGVREAFEELRRLWALGGADVTPAVRDRARDLRKLLDERGFLA